MEDTEWRPVEGLAERGGRYRTEGVTIVKVTDNQGVNKLLSSIRG
ncbi:unnamed protein product [Staurois parvus]|uniref:Uncharacterized protein n=1 Tax=Staurois parvus TaxID=386267 RepID=A0ABN9C2G1_9NEOB|nr:unnamed protein product [Staurois parvus]